MKRVRLSKKRLGIITGGILVIVLVGFFGMKMLNSVNNSQVYSALEDTRVFAPQEATSEATLSQVNKLFELPEDQYGTMAKIKDVKTLSSKQAFFKKAANGNILIFYDEMTVIYDPVNKTVVDIARANLIK